MGTRTSTWAHAHAHGSMHAPHMHVYTHTPLKQKRPILEAKEASRGIIHTHAIEAAGAMGS